MRRQGFNTVSRDPQTIEKMTLQEGQKSAQQAEPTVEMERQSSVPTDTDVETEKQPPLDADADVELQATEKAEDRQGTRDSIFKSLGLLDRFLAVWIFLAMAVGIILGNFVDNVGPALQKGKFVGVSVPIGE